MTARLSLVAFLLPAVLGYKASADVSTGIDSASLLQKPSGKEANASVSVDAPHIIGLRRESVPIYRRGKIASFKTSYSGVLSVGYPPQDFRVVFDTGSAHIILPAMECKSEACLANNRRHYDQRKSSTSLLINADGSIVHEGDNGEQVTIGFGTGDITGEFAKDTVCFGKGQTKDEVLRLKKEQQHQEVRYWVSAISCARFAKDCEGCFANNCRYCRTSPEDWSFINGEPPSIIDYACLSKTWQCIDLQQLRPDVVSVEAVAYNGCGNLVPPKGPTTRLTTTTTTKEVERIQSEGHPWWPSEWGIVVWTAIAILGGFSLLLCCYLGHRCRRRLQRVHVLPQSALDSRIFKTKASVKWDFARAGVVSEGDLEAAKKALEAALSQASGHARCLTFWASNCLRVPVLAELDRMLLRFPSLTLSLDADWKRADDATLAQLAKVLMKHRDRCKFRTVGGQALQLPVATVTTLNSLGESFSGHHEVDKVVFEKGPKDAEACRVALGALRLTSQEMIFNRQNLGDMGCSLACGFVRPWGSRLQIARLVECGVGDLGISFLARLLVHARQPAVNLKELNLSANKFGDRGMAELADALPMLDSLEKLLLERNKIGPMGAQALASRLSRSNVRELVLGTHLGGNPIGPAGVQALARGLNDALPRAAANRETRLEALALEDCQVGEEGAKALAEHLSQSALMALSVARGQLTDEDATAILLALPKSIAFLDLSGNQLSDLTASIAGETLYKRSGMSISLAANFLSPTIKMLLAEEHGTRLRL